MTVKVIKIQAANMIIANLACVVQKQIAMIGAYVEIIRQTTEILLLQGLVADIFQFDFLCKNVMRMWRAGSYILLGNAGSYRLWQFYQSLYHYSTSADWLFE